MAAERVYGVRTVADEITVELPEANVVGDAAIAETIARQLEWNTLVPETVEADVHDGFVTLRGTSNGAISETRPSVRSTSSAVCIS